MKCIYCNAEISDGAAFCTVCGKKQEQPQAAQSSAPAFCTNCGKQIKPGVAFCTNCGAKVSAAAPGGQSYQGGGQNQSYSQGPSNQNYQSNTQSQSYSQGPSNQNYQSNSQNQGYQGGTQKQAYNQQYQTQAQSYQTKESSSKKLFIILMVCIFAVLLVGLGGFALYKTLSDNSDYSQRIEDDDDDDDKAEDKDKDKEKETSEEASSETSEEVAEDDEKKDEEEEEEDTSKDADYNLEKDSKLDMTGTLEKNTDGYFVLIWDEKLSFLDGDVYLEDVKSARLDLTDWDEPIYDYAELGDKLQVKGEAYIKDEKLFLLADKIYDAKGEDITKKKAGLDGDYIIPDSDTRLLTDADVYGLNIQEINYAKNEIYAIHGRKFKSKERQDYFNSKSWYYGTIEPEDFKESYL